MEVLEMSRSIAQRLPAALLAITLMAFGTTPVQASRSYHLSSAQKQAEVTRIQAFLDGGTAVWSTTPPPIFPRSLLTQAAAQIAVGNDTSAVEYLHWRRDLNPTRFDRYHPYLGRLLANDLNSSSTVVQAGVPVVSPSNPGGTTPTKVAPGKVTTPTVVPSRVVAASKVPEPSAGLIAIALVGAFAWKIRRNRIA